MDQNKNQGQQQTSGDRRNQPQGQQSGTQHEHQQGQPKKFGAPQSDSQQSEQEHWRHRPNPRDPAEGPRQDAPSHNEQPGRQNSPQSQQRRDSSQPDTREPRGSSRELEPQKTGAGSGISNRGLDRELEEQEELPDRGFRKSDR